MKSFVTRYLLISSISFFVIIFFVKCEKEINDEELLIERSSAETHLKSSNVARYEVYYWSSSSQTRRGLKQVLEEVKTLQTSNPSIESIVITLKSSIECGTAHSINVPANTTIDGGGEAFGKNAKTIQLNPPAKKHAFVISKDNVTFKGVILKGPWPKWQENERYLQIGGIYSTGNNTTVKFCEISGFAGTAISFINGKNNIVYGNDIHHNYMLIGNRTIGYGVLVGSGATAVISHNYFDNNQHAIAGGGLNNLGEAAGYVAYNNNVKDSDGKMRSHHFDMHGNGCVAGNHIAIYNNAFYNNHGGNAIMIRGIPQDYAVVYNNAFINISNINTAVRQLPEGGVNRSECWDGSLHMYVYDNIVGGWPGQTPNQQNWVSEMRP